MSQNVKFFRALNVWMNLTKEIAVAIIVIERRGLLMVIVMQQVLLLILFASVGFVLCKTGKVRSEHTKMLSTLQVYVFLPCTIINTFSANFTVAYIREKYQILVVSSIIMVIMVVVGYLLSKLMTKKLYLQSVYQYSLTVSNYGFFGYPLVSGLFGELMLQNAMVFTLPMSLYAHTIGFAILTKTKISVKRFLNPAITASIIGAAIGLTGIKLPFVLDGLVNKSAACMAPVGMLLAGMVISEFNFVALIKQKKNYIVAFFRLLIIPCTIAASLKLLGFDDIVLIALMMYAMPCGLNTIVFPRLVGEECGIGASLTLITSLFACITVPVCVALFS